MPLLGEGCGSKNNEVSIACISAVSGRAFSLKERLAPYVDVVAEKLKSSDQKVRLIAINGLRYSGEARAARYLGELLEHEDDKTRRAALIALGNVHDSTVVDLLFERIDKENEELSGFALRAIGMCMARKGVTGKEKDEVFDRVMALQNHKYASVRAGVLWACYTCSSTSFPVLNKEQKAQAGALAIEKLIDESHSVRHAALRYIEDYHHKEAVPALRLLLTHEDVSTRAKALRVLGELRAKEAVPAIIKVLSSTTDDEVFKAALDATQQYLISSMLTDKEISHIIPYLAVAMKSKNKSISSKARGMLSCTKSAEAATLLVAHFIDNETPQFEIQTLFKQLGAAAVPELTEAVAQGDDKVKLIALYALYAIGPKAGPSLKAVLETLKSETPAVRQNGLSVIRVIKPGDEVLLKVIKDCLDDSNVEVRLAAIYALQDLRKSNRQTASDILTGLSNDPDKRINEAVAQVTEYIHRHDDK